MSHNCWAYCRNQPVIFNDRNGYASGLDTMIFAAGLLILTLAGIATRQSSYSKEGPTETPHSIRPIEFGGDGPNSGQTHALIATTTREYNIGLEQSFSISASRDENGQWMSVWGAVIAVGALIVNYMTGGRISLAIGTISAADTLSASIVNSVRGHEADNRFVGTCVSTTSIYSLQTVEGTSIYVTRNVTSENPYLQRSFEIFPMTIPLTSNDLYELCIPGYS